MKKTTMLMAATAALVATNVMAARNAPWSKEKAWEWYNAQPWMRGCNYMPASAANRVDQWQEMGCEERFAEMETELKLAQSIGFNTLRIIIEEQGFAVWCAEHDGFMARLERMLALLDKYGMRMILVLGNDCSRPKEIWKFPKTGPQPCDWGYHGGRKRSQHGSFPGAVGYTCVDDPELREKFFAMCEEVMTKYRTDRRIAFWNIWNEPGNGNRRAPEHVALLRRMFELGWKIDPVQPLAADVWAGHYGMSPKDANKPQLLAGQLSDIISYHCYGEFEAQARIHGKLKNYYGRPLVNTEWLARIKRNYVFDAYPFYAQNRVVRRRQVPDVRAVGEHVAAGGRRQAGGGEVRLHEVVPRPVPPGAASVRPEGDRRDQARERADGRRTRGEVPAREDREVLQDHRRGHVVRLPPHEVRVQGTQGLGGGAVLHAEEGRSVDVDDAVGSGRRRSWTARASPTCSRRATTT